jgi:lysophospholipid acyltransferase (LPLAT)-like uncharacterized protein
MFEFVERPGRHERSSQRAFDPLKRVASCAPVVVREGVHDLGHCLLATLACDAEEAFHRVFHRIPVVRPQKLTADDRRKKETDADEDALHHDPSILSPLSYTRPQRIGASIASSLGQLAFGFTLRHVREHCRFHFSGPLDDALARGDQVIVAAWHQDVIPFFHYLGMHSYFGRTQDFCMMSSRSYDGEVTARVLSPWGVQFVRGSHGKAGATAALRGYIREIRDGKSVAIVADGPRPPPYVFRPGAAYLARVTKVPLYVCRVWTRPQWIVPSTWFRMTVPQPRADFGVWSSGPIDVSGDIDSACRTAEQEMARLATEVDAALYCDRHLSGGIRWPDLRR